MTIGQIERHLINAFPDRLVKINISVWTGPNAPVSGISIYSDSTGHIEECRSIKHAIETLREKLKPVSVGHVEIEA